MLKNCLDFAAYHKTKLHTKCGDIIYHSVNELSIVCTYCNIKSFDLADFLRHINNAHGRIMEEIRDEAEAPGLLHQETEDNIDEIDIREADVPSFFETAFKKRHVVAIEPEVVAMDHDEDDRFNTDSNDDWPGELTVPEQSVKVKSTPQIKDKPFHCEVCQKGYKATDRLQKHMRDKHIIPQKYECDKCQCEFPNSVDLKSHRTQHHKKYACTECNKEYTSYMALREHNLAIHIREKNFRCDYTGCEKAFVSVKKLRIHKGSHNTEMNYVCEVCGFRARKKIGLDVHVRSHTGEKPFACTLCDKRFASKPLLNEHQPIHSTEKPHVCEVCGAAFSRPKALYHHKHLHLGIKKFVCKMCGKAYAQAAGLSGHMRQHRLGMTKQLLE